MFLFLNHFEDWSSNCQSRTTGFVSSPVWDRLLTLQDFDQGQSFSTDIAQQQLPSSWQRVRERPRVRDSAPSHSLLLSDHWEAGSPAEAHLCTGASPQYFCKCSHRGFHSNYRLVLLVINSNSDLRFKLASSLSILKWCFLFRHCDLVQISIWTKFQFQFKY